MVTVCASAQKVVFTNEVGKNSRYFVGVVNKTIIPLALVGYEMIKANSALRASLATYHLISKAHSWNDCLNNGHQFCYLHKLISC